MSAERQLLRRQLKAAGWVGKKARTPQELARNQEAIREVVAVRAVQRLRRMTPEQVAEASRQLRQAQPWHRRLRTWWLDFRRRLAWALVLTRKGR